MATVFDEILFDRALLRGAGDAAAQSGWPAFANTIIENPATGARQTNVNRYDALYKVIVPSQGLSQAQVDYMMAFWRGGYGSAIGFRVRLEWDYLATEEGFGTGDGVKTQFPLYRTYKRPGVAAIFSGGNARSDVRRICKPVVQVAKETNSFQLYEADGAAARTPAIPLSIKKNGSTVTNWTVDAKTGIVTFAAAPNNGHPLTWTGEFDTPMTFDAETLDHIFNVNSQLNGIPLREIGFTELGLTYSL